MKRHRRVAGEPSIFKRRVFKQQGEMLTRSAAREIARVGVQRLNELRIP
jgi:hypothetical protein